MKPEMRRSLARLPYPEKLRRVAELIEFSRRLKLTNTTQSSPQIGGGSHVKTRDQLFAGETVESLFGAAAKRQ